MGGYPQAGLIADSKGNLFGTTYVGGASGVGTVFELSPPATAGGAWTETPTPPRICAICLNIAEHSYIRTE